MTVSHDENSIKLPAKVFEFLKLLMANAEQTVTKEQAIALVWAGNVEVGKRGLGNAIWHLRKTFAELGAEPEEIFKTITKVGYLLLVTPQATPESLALATSVESPQTQQPNNAGVTVNEPNNTQLSHDSTAAVPQAKLPIWLLCLIATLLLITLWYFFKPQPDAEQPVSAQEVQLKATRITNYEGVEEIPAISPNGQYMAFQWLQQNENNQIFIKDITNDDAPLRQVSVSSNHEMSPVWSPDSQKIAYYRADNDGVIHLFVRELITNQEQHIDENVDFIGYMRGISWSPDGSKLVYSKRLNDRSAVFQYQFSDQQITQYTFPQSGERDRLMVWSPDSTQVAFVRSAELYAKLMLAQQSGSTSDESVLVDNEKMIIGLDWHHKTNQLYFNASRDADFVVEQYDIATKAVKEFHRDQTIYSIAVDQTRSELYYTRHIAQEHITIRSIDTGQVERQLVSSSRDLYGQYVPATGEIIFFSNRSGVWELWLKADKGSTQLTHNQGPFTIPAISPTKPEFIVPMKVTGAEHFALYKGELPSGKLTPLIEIEGDVRKPSYSQDGKSVYFSSNKHGKWGIYKLVLASQTLTMLVEENGKYALESDDGGIYFTKDNQGGIFYQPVNSEEEQLITEQLSIRDWGSFFLKDGQLYYLHRTKFNDNLMKIDEDGNKHLVFALPPLSIRNEKALALGKGDTVIATMLGINDADIYRVPLQ